MAPKIFRAVSFLSVFPQALFKSLRILFLSLGFAGLISYFVLQFASVDLPLVDLNLEFFNSFPSPGFFLGFVYIFLPIGFSFLFFEIFLEFYLKDPVLSENLQPIEYLDFQTAKVFSTAAALAKASGRPISTFDLLFGLFDRKEAGIFWFRLGIDADEMRKKLLEEMKFKKSPSPSPFLSLEFDESSLKVINDLDKLRREHNTSKILITDLFIALFDNDQQFRNFILAGSLDRNDLTDLGLWLEKRIEFEAKRKKFWDLENLLRTPPIGVDWVYGYTPRLNRFAVDIGKNLALSGKRPELIGRKDEIDQIERILSKAGENNVLLVGEPGIGKSTVVNGFAGLLYKGQSLPALKYKRVLKFNASELVSSVPTPQEAETLLIRVLNDAVKAGNVILFIEDIQNFIGTGAGLGRVDVSEVLKPYLGSSNLQVIATTDNKDYHKFIETRADLMKFFERVEVNEPDRAETIKILQTLLPYIEVQNKVLVTQQALKDVYEKSDLFSSAAPFPEKAIDLLSEAVADASAKNKILVLPEDVDRVVSQKTLVPLGEIGASEREKLQNLEALMHEEIVNQETAVKRMAQTLIRLRTGLGRENKPGGVFLFVGPTGVGKTLTSKILAKVYFGHEENMLRFDMSEFQNLESVDRFIGSLRTEDPGQFVSRVRDLPFSVILLDEIEKTNPKILDIFLQVFDEARLTDVFGRTISFRHNIIIATSNAGSEYIRELVNQNIDPAQEKDLVLDFMLKNNLFKPEFLNRFDDIIVFHPLNQEQVLQISKILFNKLVQRLKEQNLFFVPNDEIIRYIAGVGFDPQFGARPMEREIRNRVEVVIGKKILNGEIRKGVEFTISIDELKQKF